MMLTVDLARSLAQYSHNHHTELGVVMIERQEFRDLMAGVCAPVTVVTTTVDGRPCGATVSSFTSLSLNPPLISVAFDRGSCVAFVSFPSLAFTPPLISVAFDRGSALLGQIREAGRFGVNILGHAQDELAMTFARRGDRVAPTGWGDR